MAITEIFRRFLGPARIDASDVGVDVQVGFDFDDLIAKLHLAKMEVDRVRHQVLEEARLHASRLVEAVKRRDKDAAQIHAAELVLKKKLYKALTTYSRLLELTIVRVQDARSIESLAKALTPLEFAMRAMDDYLAATSPEVAARLSAIVETAERVVRSTGFMASNLPRARSPAEMDPELQREIARVIAEVSREVNEVMPDFDVEPEVAQRPTKRKENSGSAGKAAKKATRPSEDEIDKMVLDYIKSRRGVIKLSEASKELGIDKDEIIRAIRRLHEKGLIRVAGAQASTS